MNYVLFGAGRCAEKIIDKMNALGLSIEYIVDSNLAKHGTFFKNLPVRSPSVLNDWKCMDIMVIVAVVDSTNQVEIIKQLNNLGMELNKNFFKGIEMFRLNEAPHGWVSGFINLPQNFDSIKSFDNQSRLILLKEERRIFRVVDRKYVCEYESIYKSLEKHGLLGKYVVDTRIIDNQWDIPYGLVLEHKYIELISYSFEWPPVMFKEYVLFMIDFIEKLNCAGLTIKDGHALNAVFYNGNFLFLDFGALTQGNITYNTIVNFINTHINPLLLMSKNQISKAYLFLRNSGLEYTLIDIIGHLSSKEVTDYEEMFNKCVEFTANGEMNGLCGWLNKYCENISLDFSVSRWIGYQDEEWEKLNDIKKWTPKQKSVLELASSINPKTLIDLAGNMGLYAVALRSRLDYAIVMDLDFVCVDDLYNKIKISDGEINNIYPIYMNLVTPTLAYYKDDAIANSAIIPWRQNAFKRFRCDLALAISVVHHLAFSQQLTFAEIIAQFKLFTNRYLIVEFIQQEDEYIKDFLKEDFEWYTKDFFVDELKKEFVVLKSMPSFPVKTRTLFLCELKSDKL